MAKPDLRKVKDEAAEAAARGKWKKALEAYILLVELEPNEGSWPQKAGECCRRLNLRAEAVAWLTAAADRFSRSGFLLKAIACCKVILEIDPQHTSTQAKLAGLHAERGTPIPGKRPPAAAPARPHTVPRASIPAKPPIAPVAAVPIEDMTHSEVHLEADEPPELELEQRGVALEIEVGADEELARLTLEAAAGIEDEEPLPPEDDLIEVAIGEAPAAVTDGDEDYTFEFGGDPKASLRRPAPSPSPSPSPSPTPVVSQTAAPSPDPTLDPSPSPSPSPSPTPDVSQTPTPIPMPTPSPTPTPSPIPTPILTPIPTPTPTPTPTTTTSTTTPTTTSTSRTPPRTPPRSGPPPRTGARRATTALPSVRPPRRAAFPRAASLDKMPLAQIIPGSRRSQEISAVSEIPLEVGGFEESFAGLLDDEQAAPAPAAPTPAPAPPAEVKAPAPPPEAPATATARSLFPRTPIFSALDEAHLRLLIERVTLEQLRAGEIVFQQGDAGDALYVVASGEVAIETGGGGEGAQTPVGEGAQTPGIEPAQTPVVEVARLGEGAFFGEIAVVTDQPRTATVRATMPTDLLAIDRETIAALVAGAPEVLQVVLRFLRDRLLDTLIETSPLFRPFSGPERQALAARFRFLEAEPGATVVEQGKRAAGLFILLSGGGEVLHDDKPIAAIAAGDLFGEMSLLTRGPAVATVRVTSKSFLLELPRADFTEVIMTHGAVLEYVNALADRRQKQIDAILAGRAEGHLRIT